MSAGWRGGSTSAWRRMRAYILRRDAYTCRIQSEVCTQTADQVDHIIPKVSGGTDDETNLRAACRACNLGRDIGMGTHEPEPKKVTTW